MATAIPFGDVPQVYDNASPVSGGKIYFYVPGTSTLRTPYSDTALSVPTTNPVLLNSAGWPATNVYLDSSLSYDYIIKSADDSETLWPRTTIPSNVEGAQPVDETLTAIAALTLKNGQVVIATGTDTVRGRYIEVETLAALKLLNGADFTDGDEIYMRGNTADLDGAQGWFSYDAGSSATEDDGVVVEPADSTGRFIRREYVARKFIDLKWYGVDTGDTVTTAFDAATALGGHILIDRAYRIDDTTTINTRCVFEFQGTGKLTYLDTLASSGNIRSMFDMGSGSEGSVFIDANLDGNRDALDDAYDVTNSVQTGWMGIRVRVARINLVGLTQLANFLGPALHHYGSNSHVEHIVSTNNATNIRFGNTDRVTTGQRLGKLIVDSYDSTLPGGNSTNITPHCVDLVNCQKGEYLGIFIDTPDATLANSTSNGLSGLTVLGCKDITIEVDCYDFVPDDMYHTVTSFVNNEYVFATVRARNCSGALLEDAGNRNCEFTVDLDGGYIDTTARDIDNNWGIYIRSASVEYSDQQRRFLHAGGANKYYGIVRRVGIGVLARSGRIDLDGLRFDGNYVNHIELSVDPLADQNDSPTFADMRINDASFLNSGQEAINIDGVGRLHINGGQFYGNARLSGSYRDMVWAPSNGVAPKLRVGGGTEFEVGAGSTIANNASYAPGTTTENTSAPAAIAHQVDVFLDDITAVELLSTVTLANVLTGPANAAGTVVDIRNDRVTLGFSSAQTFIANSNTADALGGGSVTAQAAYFTSGTDIPGDTSYVLTGSGTAWETDLRNGDWITDGSEWRQVLDIVSDTSVVISGQFTSQPTSTLNRIRTQSSVTAQSSATDSINLGNYGSVLFHHSTQWIGYNTTPINFANRGILVSSAFHFEDLISQDFTNSELTVTGTTIIDGMLNLDRGSDLTIATGAITVTDSYHRVDTEASAGTDDLDTINGGELGDRLVITTVTSTRDVVIKDGTGNISCGADRTLGTADDTAEFIYNGTNWILIAYADN